MEQTYWLARMQASLEAALAATCVEDCLDNLHEAGVSSVRARACNLTTSGCGR